MQSSPSTACTVRGIFRCSLFLGVVGFIAAAFGAHALWRKTDKLVEAALLAQIQERVPDWDLTFEGARADWSGKVRVKNVVLNGPDEQPLVEIPSLILELDMDLLLESQKVQVRRARIDEVLVHLRCDDASCMNDIASWNINLPAPRPSETAPPDIVIDRAAVLVQIAGTADSPPSTFRAAGLRGTVIPDSRHSYTTRVEGVVQHLGRIEVSAKMDSAYGGCHVNGRCGQIDLEGLVQAILGVSPGARQRVARLSALSESIQRNRPVQLASSDQESVLDRESPGHPNATLSDLGLQADLSLEFSLDRALKGAPLTWSLVGEVRDGQMTNPNMPVPLYGLKGHVAVNQDGVVVRNLSASNGDSKLHLDGHWQFRGDNPERRFTCQATDLHIGPELRSYLPGPLQTKYDQLQPSGRFKIDVEYDSARGDTPIKVRELSVVDGSVMHELFPYRVTGIHGDVRQEGTRFAMNFHGQANGRKVLLTGGLSGLSPDAALELTIHASQLPLDNDLLRAFGESKQPALLKIYPVLASLNCSGTADWKVVLARPAGPNQKFTLSSLLGNVTHGTINYDRFPYSLNEVTGVIAFDRLAGDVWHFRDLHGVHSVDGSSVKVSGDGSFALQPAPGLLKFKFTALGVPLDLDLQQATTHSVRELQRAWEELSPTGMVDLTGIEIAWSPGTPVALELPSIQLRDVRIRPKHLLYTWDHLNGAAKWDGDKVVVRTLQAYHDQTYLNINGVDPGGDQDNPLAYFQIEKGDRPGWRLHLRDVQVKKLQIDDELKSALPVSVRDIVKHAEPTAPFDLALGIDMKGTMDSEVITARWTTSATFTGGDITMGLPLKNVKGNISIADGMYDGSTATAVGTATFDQATILTLPCTNLSTPFRVSGSRIAVGAPSWEQFPASSVKTPLSGRSLTTKLYGGDVVVDATADIHPTEKEKSTYAVQLQVKDVQLQQIARANQWRNRLHGDIRSDLKIKGTGSDPNRMQGNGWVQIQPARLLDLPVFVKLFEVLQFQPPENFAFKSASGEFRIHDGLFDFSQIALDGSTLSLVGQGTVGYVNKALNLTFLTRWRNKTPVVGLLLDAVGRGWWAISILGTTDNPEPRVQPRLPIVSDAVRGLMNTVERGQELRAGQSAGR